MTGTDDGPVRLAPPRAGGLVRERLIRRLDPVLSARLGVVAAPHGTGKTTLLAHWAARRPEHLVWHRADPADAQPERLLAGLARDVAALVHVPEPSSTAGLASLLAADAGRPLCIVLDDVHLIIGTPAEAELERLLLLCPPNVHLVVAGRQAPSFSLARPEFSAVVLVDGEDLRFRADEAHALFRDVDGLRIDPVRVLDLVHATDGWAAALHLFRLHTMKRSPVERHRAACDTGAHYAWDHLRRHVLADLAEDEAELLRVASMLDLVTPRRCDALLGTSGAAATALHELGRRSLLVDDDTAPCLRMPEVVRRYFADELRESTERDTYAALRGRAVELLERDGALGNALALLAADGRWPEARRLLVRSGAGAFAPGSCAWAELVPPELTGTDPWFALAEARRLFDDGRLAGARAAACRALTLAGGTGCAVIATELRARSAAWDAASEELPEGGPGGEPPLRAAIRGSPAAVARSLGADPREEDLLASGIASLLAGDRRTALPVLRRCAERLDRDRLAALAAQLVLALFESDEAGAVPDASAAEIEAVHRHARCGGLSWLARLTDGMLAVLSGSTAGDELAEAVSRDCERRGDAWGAALLHAAALLAGGSGGASSRQGYTALAGEFRALGADVLAAWAMSRAAPPYGPDAVPSAAGFPEGPLAGPRPALRGPGSDGTDDKGAARCLTGELPAGTGAPSLAVTCFGGLAVHLGGEPVDLAEVRPRARTVLRLLALNAGRPVHREWLATTLWADLDEARALHNLQVSISALRHVLDPRGAGGGRRAVLRQDDSYVLVLGPSSWSDLAEFDRLLHEADRAHRRGDPARAAVALQGALDLYTGDLLPEEGPAEWVVGARDRYRLRAAGTAGALARTRLSLGQEKQAVGAAARSVEINPWSDESWRLLIALLRDSGEVAEAERTRRRYCDMLASLGIDAGTDPRRR
ncbi:BTAD domain-containing putative transcriptional regulator [Kocuria dechangensis]|nr:BTAD domain-containing putative transcriptional regulator [Kocuria dechangensis]